MNNLHCESCDSPATRKDACGTALCGRCWSADEPTWLYRVRGADGKTRLITEAQKELLLDAVFAPLDRDEPDYDAPRPLSALENWQRNDEHNVQ